MGKVLRKFIKKRKKDFLQMNIVLILGININYIAMTFQIQLA